MPTAVRYSRRPTRIEASSAPAPAACTDIALSYARRYTPRSIENRGPAPQIREPMRAEVERLVEEIKQSVGLLRRHL
jgi:hypothetical protein